MMNNKEKIVRIKVNDQTIDTLIKAQSNFESGTSEHGIMITLIEDIREKASDTKKRYIKDEFHERVGLDNAVNLAASLIRNGDSEEAKAQIKDNTLDLNHYDSNGNTLALVAAFNGDLETLKLLEELGADLFLKNKEGFDCLAQFSARHFHVLEYISKHEKFNANEKGQFSITPIQNALQNLVTYSFFGTIKDYNHDLIPDKLKIVKLLHSMGADINHVNDHGRTALMSASVGNAHEVARLLIELGASKEVVCNEDKRAFDYAHEEDLDMREILR